MNAITHLLPHEIELLKPLAEARAVEIADANHKARAALAAELDAMAAEEAEAMPPLEAAAAASLKAFEAARTAYEVALQDAERDAADAAMARRNFEGRRDRLHRDLNRIAPAGIAELEAELREGERRTRASFYARQQSTGELELVEGRHRPRMATFTNSDEIQARVAGIRAALAKCEALRLQATPPNELTHRLADIRREALGHLR
jgi:hypothetical protein